MLTRVPIYPARISAGSPKESNAVSINLTFLNLLGPVENLVSSKPCGESAREIDFDPILDCNGTFSKYKASGKLLESAHFYITLPYAPTVCHNFVTVFLGNSITTHVHTTNKSSTKQFPNLQSTLINIAGVWMKANTMPHLQPTGDTAFIKYVHRYLH